jgi:hypothetical protein
MIEEIALAPERKRLCLNEFEINKINEKRLIRCQKQ